MVNFELSASPTNARTVSSGSEVFFCRLVALDCGVGRNYSALCHPIFGTVTHPIHLKKLFHKIIE